MNWNAWTELIEVINNNIRLKLYLIFNDTRKLTTFTIATDLYCIDPLNHDMFCFYEHLLNSSFNVVRKTTENRITNM